jgi:hypothetical protein
VLSKRQQRWVTVTKGDPQQLRLLVPTQPRYGWRVAGGRLFSTGVIAGAGAQVQDRMCPSRNDGAATWLPRRAKQPFKRTVIRKGDSYAHSSVFARASAVCAR